MKFDIVSVGSATLDVFVYTGLAERKGEISYPVGSKIKVESLHFAVGGSGVNAAASFARMGLATAFLGSLGDDENAKKIVAELKGEGVHPIISTFKGQTGYSLVLDSVSHDRTILTYKGANEHLALKDAELKKLDTKWFYFSSMLGESLKSEEKLSAYAEKKGIPIAFNPGKYLKVEDSKELRNVFRRSKVVILNQEEAEFFVGKGTDKELVERLRKLGPEIVCITCGEKGGIVSDGEREILFTPHKIKVLEVTGAGDAFAAGFVSGFIKTNDLRSAAEIGILNAESVIQKLGAKKGLLNWNELKKLARKSPAIISEKKL